MRDKGLKKRIIKSGISRNLGRFTGLLCIVGFAAFVMFAGTIVLLSLNRGIEQVENRLGADLMVVPLGYEAGAEDILIKGEPSYFYMDEDVVGALEKIKGIERVSAQYYLTSSSQGCCDIPVQFIGIDEGTDFSVTPWIKEVLGGEDADMKELLADGKIVVGSDIDLTKRNGSKLRFFDEEFPVSAQLDETGTGLDQAVFASRQTIKLLYQAALKKGFTFPESINGGDGVSSVMIKVLDGFTPSDVSHEIRSHIDGLQVIETKSMTGSLESSMTGFRILMYMILAVVPIVFLMIVFLVFRIDSLERKADHELMQQMGAGIGQIRRLVAQKALWISVPGSVLGILVGVGLIIPFQTLIKSSIGIPYLLPELNIIAVVFLASIILTFLVSALAAMFSVRLSDISKSSHQSEKGSSVHGITKEYKKHDGSHEVLKGIDLKVVPGEAVAIEGVSGSGKSTLLKIMAGLITPDTGKADMGSTAYIPQLPQVLEDLNVEDNIRLAGAFLKKNTGNNRVLELAELLSISDHLDKYPDELSGGELRRVIIARSLYADPEVILADEPTNDLDADNKNQVIKIIKDIVKKGISVIVVTHDPSVSSAMDRRYELSDGILQESI